MNNIRLVMQNLSSELHQPVEGRLKQNCLLRHVSIVQQWPDMRFLTFSVHLLAIRGLHSSIYD